MRKITALAALAAFAVLAGCGGSHPSEAACKKALKAQYATALATGQKGSQPAECKGLPAATLQRLAAEVLSGQ